jgi:hypothetical protein
MSSFILPFRAWAAAAAMLLSIEAVVYAVASPGPFDRTNFLQFSFGHNETPQRAIMYDKIRAFADSKPTFVQSGDSSGFYGVNPELVMRSLPAGMTYLNMSCCANLGFNGYYNVMELMASRNPSVRYMVLYVSPNRGTMPRPETWDETGAALWQGTDLRVFGGAIYEEFLSVWRIFHFPSLAFRRQVSDFFYYLNGTFAEPDRPLAINKDYDEFLRNNQKYLGWTPETDPVRGAIPTGECEIDVPSSFDIWKFSSSTYIEKVFAAYAAMARSYHATLIIAFQPIACSRGTGKGIAEAEAAIERFRTSNPDVEFPFPLIETWPADLFSVPAHLKREYADKVGERTAKAMAEIVARREKH